MAPKKPVSTQKTTLFSFFSKKEKKKKSVDDEAVEKDRKTTVVQPSTSELSTTKKVNAKPMDVTKTQGNNNESSRHTSPKTPPTSTDNTDNSDDDDDDMASSPLVTKKSKRNSEEETTNDTTKSKRRYVIDDDDDDDDEDEDEDPVDEEVVVIDTSSKMDVDKPPMKKATDNKKSNIDPKIVVTSTTTSSKGGKAPPAKAKKKAISSGWGFLNGDTSFKSSAKKRKKEANDSSTGHNNSHLKEPYKAGDDLPILCHPQDMFDDMILNQLCENGKRVSLLEPLIKSLHGRSLKIATMCSGTESPVLALDMIYKAIEDVCNKHDITVEAEAEDDDIESKGGPSPSRVRPVIRCEHIFSCEIEPFKQSYIERNFQPKRLFRDIRELGNDKACTAFGSLIDVPNTPGCVDILVAGTSCVDYSNLNNKKKSMDELGESGQTFQGMLNWIEKARPTIVIIENVFGAPWDEKVSIFESLGYAATFIRIDSKDYYIPQTRQRGYLFAILKDSKKSVDSKRVKGWENMMKKLERPASAALDAFMLTNDDPRVLRGRARLCKESSVGNSGESRAGRTDWTKCEGRHVFTRSNEELGEKRPLSNWSETANVSMPGFAWNDWVGSQVRIFHTSFL
jgi:site-specific DNA-cytosine methylase